jgi:ABC-type branched-subunit amino acid transport system substrate-binding protein
MHNITRKTFFVTTMTLFVSIGLVLAVFSGSSIAQSAPSKTGQKVLKIGAIVPLNLKEGMEIKKWHELFAKIINEKGGWKIGNETYRVEMLAYDHGMDPSKARAAVEKAVYQDGVKILVDNWLDPQAQTASITEPNKVLVLGGGQRDDVVSPNMKYYFRTGGTYLGRGINYVIFSDYAKKGAKTGLSVNPDTEMGHSASNLYGKAIELAGLKLLPPVFFATDTTDFSAIATKIKSANPDLVDFGTTSGAPITNLIAALKEVGYKGRIFPGGSVTANTFADIVKRVGSYFDGAETSFFDLRGIQKDPEMISLMDRYAKEYGQFLADGCFWVGGWFILQDAINATKSVDADVLKKYLENGPKGVMTLTGYRQLFARPDLQNYRTVDVASGHGIGQVQNGKLVYTKQVTVKDQYLISIKTYGLTEAYQNYWNKYGKPVFPNEKSSFDFTDLNK